jgi:glycosidase
MVFCLLFSLPGTPLLFYGEVIGMGENPEIACRQSVRTPMQWTDGKNGGFSHAAASRLVAPIPGDGYAAQHVNVQQQRNDPDSLLQFVRHLVSRYRVSPEIGWGTLRILAHDGTGVLAHEVSSDVGRMIALHNFTEVPQRVTVEIGAVEEGTALLDLHGPDRISLEPRGRIDLELAPYGFHWLRVSPPGDTRIG